MEDSHQFFIGDTGDENYGLSGYSLSRCTSGYKTSFGPDGILALMMMGFVASTATQAAEVL